jgi:hypothetical protein
MAAPILQTDTFTAVAAGGAPNIGSAKQIRVTFVGTYTGATVLGQVSNDGATWFSLLGVREDNGAGFTGNVGSANISVLYNVSGWSQFRSNCTVFGTGSLTANQYAGTFSLPQGVTPISLSFASSVVTSSSANALTAGVNGVTNPAFNVDASAGSAATGWNHVAAAAGSGVALAVLSSNVNEFGTIDSRGTGALKFNSLGGTGPIQFGGAGSGANATGLKITPNTAGAGVASTVVSTATNEGWNLNAKGSGAITIGGVSTGPVSIGRGFVGVSIFSSTKTSIATQNSTPTAAQLLTGYIQHTSVTGAGTATLDTAANIDTAIAGVATGDSFECVYSNTGTQTVTITTAAGLALKGTLAIPAGKVAVLYFFRTGSAAWDVVCVVSA